MYYFINVYIFIIYFNTVVIRNRQRRLCKSYVELDRLKSAEELGLIIYLSIYLSIYLLIYYILYRLSNFNDTNVSIYSFT
jgi:hypothetical protein